MNWYEKLNQYFPVDEMKSRVHMETLLADKGNVYIKDESPKHVLMYVEFENFIFVDYLFVSKEARGEGLGRKLLNQLKEKNKVILLEVEPINYDDTDSEKRLRFYAREEFKHATRIGYTRRSLATGENTVLEILYWSPSDEDESVIYEAMKWTYENIHTYKDEHFYGDSYDPSHEVLVFNEEGKKNMLKSY
ncbi:MULTISPECIES: GNAT family N-acetyltransferase [Bacillaceae]|uniref:GNAT family N-acetyltransferase n=1 Tax=Bacillaceae TaxID=186817 RepID=UPI0006AEB31C|nr:MULTISPECIES: GNAT family N-acetyltransferase [Bacillaceae]ALC87019.1 acetyltransferase [Bacillus sp. FJAT-22090]KQL37485.1 acetyltransferase [Psychrobacillus sp. FJAT-21963]MDF2064926.1 GNAT family N-acetyltransferase [Bacillus sp. Cr_A10]